MNNALRIHKEEYAVKTYEDNVLQLRVLGRSDLKPPPDLTVSEWADQNRILPETAAEGGRWRTSKTPHLRKVMDAVTDPMVRQITFMKSSQIGGSEALLNIIGYYIDNDPNSIILMQPTEKDARDFSTQKLEPMIEDTRCLKEKVAKKNKRDGENAVMRKKFIGGYLQIVSGKTTSSTRQRSAKITIADDIDGIEIGHTKEGDPVMRLIKRSTTYPDHKNLNCSTPTLEDASRINALYEKSNKMKYYVKCVHCGTQQILKAENITWDKDEDAFGNVIAHYPNTAKIACEGCGTLITEQERKEMLNNGEWIAERPEIKDHIGFWINEVSSTLSSIEKVARALIDAGEDPDKLEAFTNTVLGLPYKKVIGMETDPTGLIDRREDYINIENPYIPNEVLAITSAVDVQAGSGAKPARFEVEVWGWGKGEESWIIDKQMFPADVHKLESYDILEQYFDNKKFVRKDGIELKVLRKALDTGYATQTCYDFLKGKARKGWFGIKGANKYGAPLLPKTVTMVNHNTVYLLNIGTQAAKGEIYGRLNEITKPGERYFHFTKIFCDVDYFKQLTAEHAVRKTTGLVEYVYYEKKKRSESNEALDLLVYNYIMLKHLNPNFKLIEENVNNQKVKVKSETAEEKPETKQEIIQNARKIIRRPARSNYKII